MPDAPELKPLEWRERGDGRYYAIDPFGGCYYQHGDDWTHDSMSGWQAGGKVGAQADYESRIRGALVNRADLPPTLDEALRCSEVAKLVDRLDHVAQMATTEEHYPHERSGALTWEILLAFRDAQIREARAALAAFQKETDRPPTLVGTGVPKGLGI